MRSRVSLKLEMKKYGCFKEIKVHLIFGTASIWEEGQSFIGALRRLFCLYREPKSAWTSWKAVY